MPISDTAFIMCLRAGVSGKRACRRSGSNRPNTEQDSGKELAEQGGLTDPVHPLAEQAADQKQKNQLADEECQRVVGCQENPPVGQLNT
jgi:hypothetical protein